jgi:predicted DNA-binding transcriptional regulator YafY
MKGKFDRLLKIVNLLDRDKNCSVERLAHELGVTRRSIFRYLASLQEVGFPVYFDEGHRTYRFNEGFKLKKALLDMDEILALALAKRMLPFLGSRLDQAIHRLELKLLDAAQPTATAKRLAAAPIILTPQEKPAAAHPEKLLKDLSLACLDHNLVRLTYLSLYADELTHREVEPYYLFFTPEGFWILRAYCRLRADWRTFALDRIREWEVTEKPFIPRLRGPELEEDLGKGFGDYMDGETVQVVVRFTPEIRPHLERKIWHPSQKNKILKDGSLEISLATSGVEALKSWLYRWIPHFKVIQPNFLVHEILSEINKQKRKLVDKDMIRSSKRS